MSTFISSLTKIPEYCHESMLFIQEQLLTFDREGEKIITTLLPERVQTLALQIFRAFPETLVCLSILSGVAVLPATILWATRVIWVLSPIIQTIFDPEYSQEKLAQSCANSLDNLFAAYKKFVPGIFVAAACGGVAFAVFGWITADYSMMIRSSIYLVTAGIANDAMHR